MSQFKWKRKVACMTTHFIVCFCQEIHELKTLPHSHVSVRIYSPWADKNNWCYTNGQILIYTVLSNSDLFLSALLLDTKQFSFVFSPHPMLPAGWINHHQLLSYCDKVGIVLCVCVYVEWRSGRLMNLEPKNNMSNRLIALKKGAEWNRRKLAECKGVSFGNIPLRLCSCVQKQQKT